MIPMRGKRPEVDAHRPAGPPQYASASARYMLLRRNPKEIAM
jgi:hypothetical protein